MGLNYVQRLRRRSSSRKGDWVLRGPRGVVGWCGRPPPLCSAGKGLCGGKMGGRKLGSRRVILGFASRQSIRSDLSRSEGLILYQIYYLAYGGSHLRSGEVVLQLRVGDGGGAALVVRGRLSVLGGGASFGMGLEKHWAWQAFFKTMDGSWAFVQDFNPLWAVLVYIWVNVYFFACLFALILGFGYLLFSISRGGFCLCFSTLSAVSGLGRQRVPCIVKWSLSPSGRMRPSVIGIWFWWQHNGKIVFIRIRWLRVSVIYLVCRQSCKANGIAKDALLANWCVEYMFCLIWGPPFVFFGFINGYGLRVAVTPYFKKKKKKKP